MDPTKPTTSNPTAPSTQNSMPFSSSNMDVPPVPFDPTQSPVKAQTPVTSTDSSVLNPVKEQPLVSSSPEPVVPPPPPPLPSDPTSGNVITPKSGSKVPRSLIFVIVGILVLLGVGILLAKLVLPKLTGSSGTTISWSGLWETKETVQPLIDEYQASHPGVVIKYTQESKEQYRERLANNLAQGKGPDVMTIHNSWVPMFKTFLSAVPNSYMTPEEYSQTFYPIMTSDLSLGANLVGVPTGYDGLGLYVNDEIFTTYGRTAPKTWDELRETAIALTIKDDKGVIKQSGVAMGSTANIDDWQEILGLLILQNGGKLEDLSDPETTGFAQGAFSFFTVFNTKDGVWNDTLPNSTTMFANGNLAMMIAPSWRVHDIKALRPDLKFHIVPVPQLAKNSPTDPDITYATYWVSAVSNKSSVQSQSWDFLKFLSSKESYQKLYENASKVRAFGQPYPRVDMRDLVSSDQYVGGIISLAGSAKSWYLADRTWDGETGINSRINKYFEDGINALVKQSGLSDLKPVIATISQGVLEVLVDYGLAEAPVATPK